MDAQNPQLLVMTSEIVSAYVGHNALPADQVPNVIRTVYGALSRVGGEAEVEEAKPQKPAVPVRRSVTPDYIVCLEDGKKLKMLRRHLRTAYNMSPEEYRAKWNLAADYPMVAPNYAKARSKFAKQIGLGRRTRSEKRTTRGRRRQAAE